MLSTVPWLKWDVRIEPGWYEGLTEHERICRVCNEINVILFCPLYSDIRDTLYESALLLDNDFNTYSNMDTFVFLMDNEGIIRISAKACQSILLDEDDMFI